MIEAKSTHNGQYKPYGDYFKEWDVTTDLPKDEVVQWCLENLAKHQVPESSEWHANIRYGAARSGDANYYFAGYYEMKKITGTGNYHFVYCLPYCD